MLAIFTYVGVEVTIQSNLGELLKADIGEGLNAIGLPRSTRGWSYGASVVDPRK